MVVVSILGIRLNEAEVKIVISKIDMFAYVEDAAAGWAPDHDRAQGNEQAPSDCRRVPLTLARSLRRRLDGGPSSYMSS